MDIAASKIPVNIEDEMKRSYMDYAMSVIIGRALPDVRDGLKPAHRRGAVRACGRWAWPSNRPYRKCAKIVGEVIGNYHPARRRAGLRHAGAPGPGASTCATPWSTARGTSDRSTATRRRPTATPRRACKALAEEMMADLDKETVDLAPNFDETTEEPTVLPTPFPNLLVERLGGHRGGHGDEHPAAQPDRAHRRRGGGDRAALLDKTRRDRGAAPTRRRRCRCSRADPGARLPVRRPHRRAPGAHPGLQDRPRRHHAARPRADRGKQRRATATRSSSPRFPTR